MGRLKVGLIDHYANVGGGRRFTLELAQALVRAGCELRVVTTREVVKHGWLDALAPDTIETVPLVTPATIYDWFARRRTRGGQRGEALKTLAYRGVRRLLVGSYYRFDRQLRRALRGVDVAYLTWPYFLDYTECPVPLVMTFHDFNWKYVAAYSAAQNAVLERQIPQWLGGSAAVVTGTDWMRQEIEKFYPGVTRRIEVVGLPASALPEPLSGAAQARLFRRWNLAGRFALCPAGLWVHKNHEGLVEAFARLKGRGQRLTLVCTGMYTDQAFGPANGGEAQFWERAQQVRQMACEAGLSLNEDIIGLGHVSDQELATLYSRASCVVMAVTHEAGSFPLLEAAAQGVPIACSDIPVYREQAARYGWQPVYFDPAAPAAIAQALERLLVEPPPPPLLAEVAQRVRARGWDDVAAEYRQVFETVV
jgi:glycosyltransferase involved in cell wall biosynthesis